MPSSNPGTRPLSSWTDEEIEAWVGASALDDDEAPAPGDRRAGRRRDRHAGRPRPPGTRGLVGFVLVSLVVAAIAVATRASFPPFILLFGYLFGTLLWLSRRAGRAKTWFYNLSFVFLAAALAEAWLYASTWSGGTWFDGPHLEAKMVPDPDRGYAVPPGPATYEDVKRNNRGDLIYRATYHVDAHGYRVTPPSGATPEIHFYGDSFMFGEGVQDAETMPWQVARQLGRMTRNYGLHGYGPHQMLRSLENDLAGRSGAGRPDAVVYVAILDHIDRAAGRSGWDQSGPFYQVVDGRATWVGTAGQAKPLASAFHRAAARSNVWYLGLRPYAERVFIDTDRRRVAAIVKRATELSAQRGAKYVFLLWDVGPYMTDRKRVDADALSRLLADQGVPVLRLSERAPELERAEFYIPGDAHPNARGQARAAQLIAAAITGGAVPQ